MLPYLVFALGLSRVPSPRMMGGLTGLPRIPSGALSLTKRWNPSGEYSEPIATLWRDLETLYGDEDTAGLGGNRNYRDTARYVDSGVSTNKFRGMTRSVDLRQRTVLKAVKQVPTLLNPAVSNRFEFARAKAILTAKLGSQRAAIDVMRADPSVLQLGDSLEDKSVGQIKSSAFIQQVASAWPAVLLVAVALIASVDGEVSVAVKSTLGL